MEMQLDTDRIKQERLKQAWSQEKLATLSGLGLRTVQRIEASGSASLDSAAAIATVLNVAVSDIVKEVPKKAEMTFIDFGLKRIGLFLVVAFGAMIFSPPLLTLQFGLLLVVWLTVELFFIARKNKWLKRLA